MRTGGLHKTSNRTNFKFYFNTVMSSNKPTIQLSSRSTFVHADGSPLIIAGPCSAESEEQMLQTAKGIKEYMPGVKIFRAGIWKPRTRPNAFEGVGSIGLKWLKTVKQEFGFLTACEVANANHAYEALKHGVDILWIGARTTVNPFSVQEIADALSGVDVPVLVKNPVNPDIQLWIGALERLNKAGITDLGAIHRGFSTFDSKPYRNHPKWNTAIEFKRLLPEIPLLCDPSHIAGNRPLLQPVGQRAIDLAMDGLMIETHINPDVALSDASQQVTPKDLRALVDSFRLRQENPVLEDNQELLEEMRQQIDYLDDELMEVLSRRSRVSEKIGEFKKANNMTILQVKRWDQILENLMKRAGAEGLEEDFVKAIFQEIHKHSINVQTKVMNNTAVETKP
jgi:chorismate mutase